jgi:DNA repair photolyase
MTAHRPALPAQLSGESVGEPRVVARIKGRGSADERQGRFEGTQRVAESDGWPGDGGADAPARVPTEITAETARSILSHNQSPDVPFATSINPYRGCEHGCIYCYARPTHAYLNLGPGIDFETRLTAKTNAAELLRRELGRPGYTCTPIALGANTDAYQPAERTQRITRRVLEVLAECRHPVIILTKGSLVERDLDLLAPMAAERLVHVYVSVTSLDNRLSAKLEPRASAPHRRVETIRALTAAGVPTGVLVAPVIPRVTDQDMEEILDVCRAAGAVDASYVLLRLPHEVKDLFRDWLAVHLPERAAHVMSLVQQMRGGADNDPRFGSRMRGEGVFAQLLARRFQVATKRLGYAPHGSITLDTTRFRHPDAPPPQGELFGE